MGSAEKLFENRKDQKAQVRSEKSGGASDELSLLTYDDLEGLIKIPKRTIRRLVAREDIPFLKIGRKVRFSRSRILDWLREKGDM